MQHNAIRFGAKWFGARDWRRPALAAAMVGALGGAALAAPAYSVFRMSCAQAQAVVAARGAAVMYTAPASARGPETYERFVRHSGFCDPHETTEPAWAPARDNPQCLVGNRCVRLELPDVPDIRIR